MIEGQHFPWQSGKEKKPPFTPKTRTRSADTPRGNPVKNTSQLSARQTVGMYFIISLSPARVSTGCPPSSYYTRPLVFFFFIVPFE